MFKKAFTLAETLLVMAIIGIVATATIPNLMDSYQEDRDVAKLRGVYHDLEVAYAKAVAEYGPYNQWGNDYYKYLTKYLKANPCGESLGSCFPSQATMLGIDLGLKGYTYELENGVGLLFTKNSGSVFFAIAVALNGGKGKHQVQRDIFGFSIDNNGVYPYGRGTDHDSSGKANVNLGYGFAATNWVITNGNMDYLRCADKLNWTNQTSCP